MMHRSGDIVRPLLSTEKGKILQYLKEKEIPYCEDSSNCDMRFLRNRIRHKLLPYLEKNFDKGVRSALCKSAETLAEDEKVLEDMTENALEHVLISQSNETDSRNPLYMLNRNKIVELPPAIQRRVIEKILWKLGSEARYSHILQVIKAAQKGAAGSEIHLSKGLRVGVQPEYLEFLYPKGKSSWRGKLYGELKSLHPKKK